MRKINLVEEFDISLDELWQYFEDIDNYPRYIKYCHKAELLGAFQAGSRWYDWSSVAFFPLKITHEILTVTPKKEIVYQIKLPSGGELWQKFLFSDESGKAKLEIEISIEFNSKLIDKLVGPIIYARNKNMIMGTIKNFKGKQNENR